MGVDSYLKVTTVWKNLKPGLSQKEVADYLCPIIAQTQAEQDLFYDLFDRYAIILGISEEEIIETSKEEEALKVPEEKIEESKPNRIAYIILGLILAGIFGSGTYYTYKHYFPDPIQGCMDEAALNFDPTATLDCCCKYPEDPPVQIIGCMDSTAINFNPEAEIACEDCCDYTGCKDSTAINFNPRATIQCDSCCEYPAKPSIIEKAQRDSVSYKPKFESRSVELPELVPIDANFWTWLADNKRLFSWILYGLLLAIALASFLWRRAKQNYIARKERGEEPPYRLPIGIRKDRPIAVEQDFFLAINRLRGRTESRRQKLNIPRTVKATAKSGGQIDFRFDAFSRPIEYLLLIDKNTEQNHQSQLFDHLYQRFVHHEIYATRYFYDGTPQICWNEEHPSGINLERILQLHGQARLLILSDAHSFINPTTGEIESWVQILQQWKERAVITPAPMADWNYQEATLARFFVVMPSNMKGLLEVVRHFDDLPTPGLKDWKYDIGKNDQSIEIEEGEDPIPILKKHFSLEMRRWITACALYPELHWDLTLELGYVLSPLDNSLVTFKNLAQLARLDWFKNGDMPNEVRTQLLNNPDFDQEDRLAVRGAIINILEANIPEDQDSYAFEEHQMHLAINKLLVNRIPEEKQKWLDLYQQQHAKGVQEDYVAAAELDKNFNQLLDFALPDWFRNIFYPKGRMALGMRSWAPLIIAGVLGLLVYLGGLFIPDPCPGERAQLPFSEEEYCLSNAEDSLKFYTLSGVRYIDSLQIEEFERIDSFIIIEFSQIENTDLVDSIYYQSIFAQFYNKAINYYEKDAYENVEELLSGLHNNLNVSNLSAGDSALVWEAQKNLSLFRDYEPFLEGEILASYYYSIYIDTSQVLEKIDSISNPLKKASLFYEVGRIANQRFINDTLTYSKALEGLKKTAGQIKFTRINQYFENQINKAFKELNDIDISFGKDSLSMILFFDILHLRGLASYFSLTEKWNKTQKETQEDRKTWSSMAHIHNFLFGASFNYYLSKFPGLIDELDFYFVDSLSDNRVRVRRDGKYGFIKRDRSVLPPGTYENLPYDYATNFSNGRATVTIGSRQCIIDTLGNEISCFTQLRPYQDRNTDLWGYETELGVAIIPAQYEEAGEFTSSDLARVKPLGQQYGYIRLDNSPITNFEYEIAGNFREGMAYVSKGTNQWGFINTSGDITIPLEFEWARSFENGRAEVKKGDLIYFIDIEGKCVSNCPTITFRGRVVTQDNEPLNFSILDRGGANDSRKLSDGYFELEFSREARNSRVKIQFEILDHNRTPLVKVWEEFLLDSLTLPTIVLNLTSDNRLLHTVKEGETMLSIAQKYELTVGYLKDINRMEVNEIIIPFQRIYITEAILNLIDPRDNQTYKTIRIGDQVWMAENLNYAMPNSWCYLEMEEMCEKAGRLYTWDAAMEACPEGWHLPTNEEWGTLFNNYGGLNEAAYQALIQGGDTDFNSVLGGYRYSSGEFDYLTEDGYYWSATENDAGNAWYFHFNSVNAIVYRNDYGNKLNGRSCRCLQD